MELGKHVVGKGLLDRDGRRAGKVDDLLLEIPEPFTAGELPEPRVKAILTGPLALARDLPGWTQRAARWAYRLLGVDDPQPVEIPWERVAAIDVLVHVDLSRDEAGFQPLADAVRRRFIERIPGAGV